MKPTTVLVVASSLTGLASALPYMGPGPLKMRQQMTSDNSTWTDLRGKVSISIEQEAWLMEADVLQIKHVVYLMMENHSFDNIAGYWDFNDIDNLRNITYCNQYTNPNCILIMLT
ncbi:unnamed protein product [Aureobasidium uvarum]|uniref:Acid phosphatase n=1 Tax=Aureobasidium uvarum TaxID=2773716 RepID=A0A9N8KQA7_9PEZI|nr:unnamed protein product [Aureobasidium uvarum]